MENYPLERNATYESDYSIWKYNYRSRELTTRLFELYLDAIGNSDNEAVSVVNGDMHEGLVFYFDEETEQDEPYYLMDWMRDAVLAHNYELHLSDYREMNNERRERHSLKPVELQGGFGNISIELIVRGQQPEYLKLMCTHTLQREEKSIHDLLRLLFADPAAD